MKKRTFIKVTGSMVLGTALAPSLISCNEASKGSPKEAKESPIGELTLPKLPYDYSALSPIIDERTMKIHHNKHHGGYTKKANKALTEAGLKEQPLNQILTSLDGENDFLRNNLGGYINHDLFWKVMTPGGNQELSNGLKGQIEQSFGSLEALKEQFASAAMSVFGSGWAWLCWNPSKKKLFISSTPNQDNPRMKGLVEQEGSPILGIDVWEHAYYLNYQNKRAEYVKGFMELINWSQVSKSYDEVIS